MTESGSLLVDAIWHTWHRRGLSPRATRRGLVAVLAVVALGASPAFSITIGGSFGASGAGGSLNGQPITVGDGGSVFEVDAFVAIDGLDLNGATAGNSAQLGVDGVPSDLILTFSSSRSSDGTDLVLSYALANVGTSTLAGMTFLSFLDAEIDEPLNTFFNEIATASGTLAAGQAFEADEPGYVSGDIFDNLRAGSLDGSNAFPPEDDVSLALSFDVGDLGVGDVATFRIMISEDGDRFGAFDLTQSDTDPDSTTRITYSGDATVDRFMAPTSPIPEPSAALLFVSGWTVIAASARRRAAARRAMVPRRAD